MQYRWNCACCDKEFDSLPLDWGFAAPDHWVGLSDEEKTRLGRLTSDTCTIKHEEGRHIFIRGCLEIPIIGCDERLVWGVWVSVSEQSFARILELWTWPSRKTSRRASAGSATASRAIRTPCICRPISVSEMTG